MAEADDSTSATAKAPHLHRSRPDKPGRRKHKFRTGACRREFAGMRSSVHSAHARATTAASQCSISCNHSPEVRTRVIWQLQLGAQRLGGCGESKVEQEGREQAQHQRADDTEPEWDLQGGWAGRHLLRIAGTSPNRRPGSQPASHNKQPHLPTPPLPPSTTWETMSRVTEVAPALANSAARSAREACRGGEGAHD